MHRVSGDVGRGITMGRDKRIEWSSLAELGNFKGELSFEIQVEVVSALTLLTNPPFFKRGKTEPIHWRGGDKKENVKIELVKAGVVVSTIGTVANTGSTEGKIPGNLALGDYQLRLTNAHETVSSQPFPIKRRFPTLVKVIPLVVVAAIVVVVAGGKKGGGSTPPKDPPLARPPYILD